MKQPPGVFALGESTDPFVQNAPEIFCAALEPDQGSMVEIRRQSEPA